MPAALARPASVGILEAMASLTLDWLQIASLVGALQGLLLTGVLFAQKKNRTANVLLAVLMATFTIYLSGTVYFSAGLVRLFTHFFGVSYQTPWVFGPLVYLYARAASDRSWRFEKRTLIHFVPVAINTLAFSPYYFMSGAEKLAMMDRWIAGDVPLQLAILDPFKYISGLGYSIATVMYLRRHRQQIEHSYSNIGRVNLTWLMTLTVAAFGIWLLATSLKIAGVAGLVRDAHISLAMAVLVYAIGYMGLRQPEVFRYETAEYPVPKSLAAVQPPAPPPDEPEPAQRYERSGLSDVEARRLKTSLLAIMDAKRPWRDSELTLADLAEQLGSTPHKLSEVLNSEVGETFYDFVNGYRVREVQRRIKAGEARALKMLALAMDAGFASKSTFNQAFKKHTSQTPSDFRQAVGA
jgi:AraC-like DNA-binding protein